MCGSYLYTLYGVMELVNKVLDIYRVSKCLLHYLMYSDWWNMHCTDWWSMWMTCFYYSLLTIRGATSFSMSIHGGNGRNSS